MSNNPDPITFARLNMHCRTMDRGFAFYTDRKGREVFVHISRRREVIGEGDDLSLGGRVEATSFPTQIVLRVGPGKRPGQHAAIVWGADPEPRLKRHTDPWHAKYPFGEHTKHFIGGEVSIQDLDRRWLVRPLSGVTLTSLEVRDDTVTMKFSDGRTVRGKWWDFGFGSRRSKHGHVDLLYTGSNRFLKIGLNHKRE